MSDDDLRDQFRALREKDSKHAPAFSTMWRRPVRASSRLLWVLVPAAATGLAAAFLFMVPRRVDRAKLPEATSQPLVFVRSTVDGVAPLDFLLEPPFHASLAGAPNFDDLPAPTKEFP